MILVALSGLQDLAHHILLVMFVKKSNLTGTLTVQFILKIKFINCSISIIKVKIE